MRYLSLCSGIEAATVAWRSLGWQPVAFAEIEPFPCAVLKHHYPEIPNLGDITRIDGSRYRGAVDLVVGGTPCQDFSIAGQRAGLAGERGGLALVFTQILSVVRPEWVVWENVPGVFSTNGGRDFGAFLRALDDIGYSCAWRVLDAQFFGVPQRRRRVYIVGHLGDWRPAAAVLFEPQSLRGNTAPCKKKRTDVTQSLTRCLGAGGADDNRAQGGFYVSHIVGQAMSCKWAKGTSGPVAETEEGAVRKWNTLARSPRRLRWSKEPPKEPGYYWHEEDHEKQPVHVFHGATQEGEISLYAQFFNEGYEVHKIESMSGKWAGPIPEPEE